MEINKKAKDLKVYAKFLSILVVEDEVDLSHEIKSLLDFFFKDVQYANNGLEALEKYKQNYFDIVLTDLDMPKMNGIELCKEIRKLKKNQIIVVLSGLVDTFIDDLIKLKVESILKKPYSLEDFLHTLSNHCEHKILKKEFDKIILNKILDNHYDNYSEFLSDSNSSNKTITYIIDKKVETRIEKFDEDEVFDNNLDLENSSAWRSFGSDILLLNEDIENTINLISSYGFDEGSKRKVSKICKKYEDIFRKFNELNELALVFLNLSEAIELLDTRNLNKSKSEIALELEFFYENIIDFFSSIFVDKNEINPTYHTQMFKSYISKFENL